MESSIKELEKNKKKILYLNKVKYLITNTYSDNIKKQLNINPLIIYHTNNIKKKITIH